MIARPHKTTSIGMAVVAMALVLPACSQRSDNLGELSRYNVAWDRPGNGSKDSMPLGNGDISLNVWTEKETGSVCFYIGKTDAWDETSRLLKIGKVQVKIEPNPFAEGRPFRQKLSVRDAAVEVTAGDGAAAVSFRVWADANLPVVRVETYAPATCAVTASIEPWRLEPEVMKDALVSGLNYYPEIFGPTVVGPDVVMDEPAARIVWYHRNPETPSFAKNLTMQGLEDAGLKDPLKDRIFGAIMEGRGLCQKRGQGARLREGRGPRAQYSHPDPPARDP